MTKRKSKHGCSPSPYGKRTKLWWAMLNLDERKELWHLERAKVVVEENVTDKCGHCGLVINTLWDWNSGRRKHDLCKVCWERWEHLVAKASIHSEYIKNILIGEWEEKYKHIPSRDVNYLKSFLDRL